MMREGQAGTNCLSNDKRYQFTFRLRSNPHLSLAPHSHFKITSLTVLARGELKLFVRYG